MKTSVLYFLFHIGMSISAKMQTNGAGLCIRFNQILILNFISASNMRIPAYSAGLAETKLVLECVWESILNKTKYFGLRQNDKVWLLFDCILWVPLSALWMKTDRQGDTMCSCRRDEEAISEWELVVSSQSNLINSHQPTCHHRDFRSPSRVMASPETDIRSSKTGVTRCIVSSILDIKYHVGPYKFTSSREDEVSW